MNRGEATLVMSGEATRVIDRVSGKPRPGTRDDWLQATRLIDAVDEIGVYWAMIDSGGMTDGGVTGWVDYTVELQRSFSAKDTLIVTPPCSV